MQIFVPFTARPLKQKKKNVPFVRKDLLRRSGRRKFSDRLSKKSGKNKKKSRNATVPEVLINPIYETDGFQTCGGEPGEDFDP